MVSYIASLPCIATIDLTFQFANVMLKVRLRKMDWTAKNTFKIIHLYKQFECLWNYKSPDYKSTGKKHNAWQVIAKAMKIDVCEAKKKIKHLRTAYVSEKKKVAKSKKAATSPEMLHQPRLFYFHDMAFLDAVVSLRYPTISYLDTNSLESTTEPIETIELDGALTPDLQDSPMESPSQPINCTPSFASSPAKSSSLLQRSSSSRKLSRKLSRYAKFDSAVDAIVASETQVQHDNVFTSFGKTIALQLQTLPYAIATQTMSEIHRHVTSKILTNMNVSQPATQQANIVETALHNADINLDSKIF